MNDMDCSECDVLAAAIDWATESIENKQLLPSPENLKAQLGECLDLIRFPTMTATEFMDNMEKYPGFFDSTTLLDVLQYILNHRPLTYASQFNLRPRTRARQNQEFYVMSGPSSSHTSSFNESFFD